MTKGKETLGWGWGGLESKSLLVILVSEICIDLCHHSTVLTNYKTLIIKDSGYC